jgi:hypothetical protein
MGLGGIMKLAIGLAACLLWCSTASVVAKDGDIDEYATRQKIRKFNPKISEGRETEVFILHKTSSLFRDSDKNFDGQVSPEELRAAVTEARNSPAFLGQVNDYRRGAAQIPTKPNDPSGKPKREAGEPERNAVFILRRKFDQVSSLAFPGAADQDATGATFSYGRDNVILNSVWTAQGVAAVMFGQSYPVLDQEEQRFAPRTSYAIGPYMQFDKLSNSNVSQQKSNLDNLTFGVIGEVGLQNMSIGTAPITNYLRIKGGTTTDFEGVLKSWRIGGEWQPVSNALGLGAPVPVNLLRATVTPTLKVRAEYAGIIGKTAQPIFAYHNEAIRIGPTVGLLFAPVKLDGYWPTWLQNMSLGLSYSFLQDLRSPARYGLFDAAFTYFMDENKTLGLTFTYQRGQLDQTGAKSDTFLAGLSLKLYQDLTMPQDKGL